MTGPVVTVDETVDPASDIINLFVTTMKQVFNPNDAVLPPMGGGSTIVRFLAGDVVPLELWDAFTASDNCGQPFLWVRLMRRSLVRDQNIQRTLPNECAQGRVIDIEVGVGRCAALGETVDWAKIALEAEVSLSDSWRIETAMCIAASKLRSQGHNVGIGTVIPYGPEGGVVAWSGDVKIEII